MTVSTLKPFIHFNPQNHKRQFVPKRKTKNQSYVDFVLRTRSDSRDTSLCVLVRNAKKECQGCLRVDCMMNRTCNRSTISYILSKITHPIGSEKFRRNCVTDYSTVVLCLIVSVPSNGVLFCREKNQYEFNIYEILQCLYVFINHLIYF